jgi:hypothetical protein
MVQESAERLIARGLKPDARDVMTRLVNLAAEAGVIDPDTGRPFTLVTSTISEKRVSLTAAAVAEYKTQPHTPELMTSVFQRISSERAAMAGLAVEVTPFPYTQEQLAASEAKGYRFGYLPAGLETQEYRPKLGRIFPKMQSNSVKEGNTVTNDESPSGWFEYEAAIDAPYTETTEDQLMDRLAQDGRKILSLNEYIIASQDSKLFTGHYLDEFKPNEFSTWVRLGSRHDGRMVLALFDTGGRLSVDSGFRPDDHGSHLGARSSGVNIS